MRGQQDHISPPDPISEIGRLKRRVDWLEKKDPPGTQAYFIRIDSTLQMFSIPNGLTHIPYNQAGTRIDTYDSGFFLLPDASHIAPRVTAGGIYLVTIQTFWNYPFNFYRYTTPQSGAGSSDQYLMEAESGDGTINNEADNRLGGVWTVYVQDNLVNPNVGGTPDYIHTAVYQNTAPSIIQRSKMEIVRLGDVGIVATTIL